MTAPRPLRCAIYTRKSTEEGLDQEYNSLHAQRDACEAYIRSQAGEGWEALSAAYDDGGISGGTMERPGLKQLLADIAAKRVDVVVVYKVDRLTRSLGDFSKIVDVFDKNGVAFVSVTQSFNTTSSMGRLTLNMLLSFAQFEREVTGERIRDKIAASKKKGMWMGGNLPLGYDADGRTLKINVPEAETVRHIFGRYLALKSVHRLVEELETQGIRSKRRETKAGVAIGGEVFSRGALFHLLSNRTYLGLITHKKEAYPGQHKALIDSETFEAAQALMKANSIRRTSGCARRTQSSLMGRLFDEDGLPMTPSFANGRGGKRYRYYVARALQQGGTCTSGDGKVRRVPGPEAENFIWAVAHRLWGTDESVLDRATIRTSDLELAFARPESVPEGEWTTSMDEVARRLVAGEKAWWADNILVVRSPARLVFRGGRKWVDGAAPHKAGKASMALVGGLRQATRTAAKVLDPETRGSALGVYDRRLIPLAFLAPDIQKQIVEGSWPTSVSLADLLAMNLPASWKAQRLAILRLSNRMGEAIGQG